MLTQFGYLNNIFINLKDGIYNSEDRDRAIKFIQSDCYYAYQLILNKLYKNEIEKKRFIHKALRSSDQAYNLIIKCRDELTYAEADIAIQVVMERPEHCTRMLIEHPELLNEEQRIECLEMLLLTSKDSLYFINNKAANCNDKVYMLTRLKDNLEVIINYIKKDGTSVKNDITRQTGFKYILSLKDRLWKLATYDLLFESELEQLYKLYGKEWSILYHKTYYSYYDFCRLFNKWLSDDERNLMAKKIMTKSKFNKINTVCNNVTFPNDTKDKIQAFELAKKLSDLN